MLQIEVEYYDKKHKGMLENGYAGFTGMEQLVKQKVNFSEEELFSFCIFKHQQMARSDMRTYRDLQGFISRFRGSWEHYFDFSDNSVKSRFPSSDLDNSITETMGVGIALILANKIYGLEEPDWQKIPMSSKKDTDFRIASTGKRFIEVEAKGSVVDKHGKLPKICKHKKKILDKKDVQRDEMHNKNELIGIISAFPSDSALIAKSYLLDPPAKEIIFDPLKYKLLARLYYYWQNLRILSRAHIVEILINRIRVIERLDEYQSLDKLPLLNRNNKSHCVPDSLFESRSITINKTAFGEVVPLKRNDDEYFFYGLNRDLVNVLIKQEFDKICSIKYDAFVQHANIILAKLPKNFVTNFDPPDIHDNEDREDSRKLIKMKGDIDFLSSGKVIGFVRPI